MKFKNLKRAIRTSPLRNSKLYHTFRYCLRKQTAITIAKQYTGSDNIDKKTLMAMKYAMVNYHWDFSEFFMYNFANLSPSERKSFIPEYEKNIFCDRVNDYNKAKIFDSKWLTYTHFKKYYGRDVILLSDSFDLYKDSFKSFIDKHRSFIVKPDSDASGRGIKILHVTDCEDAVKKILDNYSHQFDNLVIEELIIQADEMARFHPDSVNTIRMRSFRFDDRVEILPCNMRIGQGGAVVDNTGQGGISAALDDNGQVTVACDEAGKLYYTHPNTDIPIVGYCVHKWDEAVKMIKELALIVPEVRYVGWDIALTDNGWVLIEGNDKGMFVGIQKTTQKGFRPVINRILNELDLSL